jgi:hypothetical protein
MPRYGILRVLAEHWDEILPFLGGADVALIAQAVRRIEAGPEPDRGLAADDIGVILLHRLPYGHPVLALLAGQMRWAGTASPDASEQAGWSEALNLVKHIPGLGQQADGPPPRSSAAGHREPALGGPGAADERPSEVSGEAGEPPADAESWLLAAPALTEQQVREQGGDPGGDDLIRLPARDGQIVLPAFQFGPVCRPLPVVAAINRLLEAAEDPWGVADWWLGQNAWLGGIPSELLGSVDDDLLVRAARAELPGD